MLKLFINLMLIFPAHILGGRILFCSPPELLSHRLSIHPVAKSLEDLGHEVLSFALSVQQPSHRGPVPEYFPIVEDVDNFFWENNIWHNSSAIQDVVWNMHFSPFFLGKKHRHAWP